MFWLGITILAFLLIRTVVTVTNWLAWPKLPQSKAQHQDLVSILIPARNEEQNIGKTLKLIATQEYTHYEILVLDDHSDDGTAQVVEEAQAQNPKIKLFSGDPLPKGWLGKNWACHQLAQKAKGDFLLFIDADVAVQPKLITSALSEVKKRELSLLSIFPDQALETWGEKVAVPIMHYLLLTLLPLHFVRLLPYPSLAAANGQFMLFKADTYREFQFHHQVRQQITEDIETVRFMKQNSLKAGTYLGNKLVICRMYHSYADVLDGFSKNLLSGFGNSILGLLIFLLFTTAGFVSFFWLPLPLAGLGIGCVLLMQTALARLSNQPIWETLLLHPIKMATLVAIAFRSIRRKLTKNNTWKGRNVALDE